MTFAKTHNQKLQPIDFNIKSVACKPGYFLMPLQNSKHFISAMNLASKQSASNGSLMAAMVSFGPDVDAGDFYAPANIAMKKPIKVVAKGSR